MAEAESEGVGYVYTLRDPRDGATKYVGATSNPAKRLYSHLHGGSNDDVQQWIADLEAEGLEPEMHVVNVRPVEELSEAELRVIDRLSDEWDLLNRQVASGYTPAGHKATDSSGGTVATVPDEVYQKVKELSEDRDITMKATYRLVFREAGYDV